MCATDSVRNLERRQSPGHIDKDQFKRIFHDHWPAFKAANPRYATAYYDEVVRKMLDCGDPEKMGYAGYRCLDCGSFHRLAMTCKSAFCLSCAKPYTDRWVDFIGRRLIPGVVYRHVVLTVPDFLQIHFYRNRDLLGPFMQLALPCLRDVFAATTQMELDIGLVVVLQTFGRPGTFNAHLHVLLSAGGLTRAKQWKAVNYIPYEILHRKWQYYLLGFLKANLPPTPEAQRDIECGWHDYPKGFVAHVQEGAVPPGGKGLAHYLAKYVVSPPISVRRIQAYDGQSVRYWYRDHKTKRIEHETLPALRFIGRMVQHILPKGFQRIRYYGFHANARYEPMRAVLQARCGHGLPVDPRGFRVLPRKPFQLLFWETYGKDPRLCPHCHAQMQLECLWHPRYGFIADLQHSVPYANTA